MNPLHLLVQYKEFLTLNLQLNQTSIVTLTEFARYHGEQLWVS